MDSLIWSIGYLFKVAVGIFVGFVLPIYILAEVLL